MPVKIHVNDGTPLPDDTSYFIVAGNGLFLRKRTGWVDATIPVQTIDGLGRQETQARLLLPRMTSTVFAKAVRFFHAAYKKTGTEAALLLHFNQKRGWTITIPEQEATAAHVDYAMTERLPGYQCVGTMHSHCSMSAFHSGTDISDEAKSDGIHITIGLLDLFPNFGMDAEFVVNGNRFPLTHEHIVYVKVADEAQCRRSLTRWFPTRDTLYTIPFGILHDWTVPDAWVERVKKKSCWSNSSADNHGTSTPPTVHDPLLTGLIGQGLSPASAKALEGDAD